MNTHDLNFGQWNERCNAIGTASGDTESMFHLLIERIADAVWLFDPCSRTVLDCNQATVSLMRCNGKAELLGKRVEDLSPAVQPNGMPMPEAVNGYIEQTLGHGNARFEWLIRRFDGSEVPLEVNATAIQREGKPVFVMVSRDIADRKNAEQQILALNASLERRVAERTAELLQANQRLESEVNERRRQDNIRQATFQISEAVHTADNLPNFYTRVHAIVNNLMPARNFYIAFLDTDTDTISFPYFVDEQDLEWPKPRRLDTGLTSVVLRTGKPLLVSRGMESTVRRDGNTVLLTELNTTYVEAGKHAAVWLGTPLISKGRAFGVMAVQDYDNDGAYGESETQILTFVAEQTALAIERKRTEQNLRNRSRQMQRHRDVLLNLAQADTSNFSRALQNICSAAAVTSDVARVSYWSLSQDKATITCELLFLRDSRCADASAKGARLNMHDAPAYFRALDERRPIVANDVLTHNATRDLGESYLKPLGISSMLDAPVWVHGEVVGVLCHEHTGLRRRWSAEEIDFASALAAMVSLSLEESQRALSEQSLRESEEKFRALFEASSQGVILHDENKMLEVNQACVRILGYDHANELIGKHPAETSAPIQPNGEPADLLARKYIKQCIEKGSVRFDWLARNLRGQDIPIEVMLTRIQWGGRQLIQAVFNDISERKRAEAEILKTLAREKELGHLRSNFVSMVSHEFRTPLAIIQSSAEILEDYSDRLEVGERNEHLQSIRKNTRRMSGLMEEVLLVGRIDAGKLECQRKTLDIRLFANRLVDEVHLATDRRCPIELSLPEAPLIASADERLLRHIFSNLLTNGVKYSLPGATVRMKFLREEIDLVCTVSDEGIGIPETDREWVFSAFHRGGNVGDRPGTGLGLVIVKRCVDLHGGKIKVDSRLNEGTSMTVRLPVFS